MPPAETFWTLLHDRAHWEFEIFLMLLFDGVIGAILWPFLRSHWRHHVTRDAQEGTRILPPQEYTNCPECGCSWEQHIPRYYTREIRCARCGCTEVPPQIER